MRKKITPPGHLELLEENRLLRAELDTLRAEKFARREREIAYQTVNRGSDLLTPRQTMAIIGGYDNQDAFMRSTRREGLPRIKLNNRVVRFERSAVEAFLRRRAA